MLHVGGINYRLILDKKKLQSYYKAVLRMEQFFEKPNEKLDGREFSIKNTCVMLQLGYQYFSTKLKFPSHFQHL